MRAALVLFIFVATTMSANAGQRCVWFNGQYICGEEAGTPMPNPPPPPVAVTPCNYYAGNYWRWDGVQWQQCVSSTGAGILGVPSYGYGYPTPSWGWNPGYNWQNRQERRFEREMHRQAEQSQRAQQMQQQQMQQQMQRQQQAQAAQQMRQGGGPHQGQRGGGPHNR